MIFPNTQNRNHKMIKCFLVSGFLKFYDLFIQGKGSTLQMVMEIQYQSLHNRFLTEIFVCRNVIDIIIRPFFFLAWNRFDSTNESKLILLNFNFKW